MISKNDALLLLSDLESSGVDTKAVTQSLISSREIPLDVLKFINDYRPLDLTNFYNKLRKSYNEKHSKLYISILKEVDDVETVLTTLSSLNLQILLFSKSVEDKQMFLKHARAREINMVLTKYLTDYDLTTCLKLLRFIKADIMCLEYISGKRTTLDN